MNGIKMSDCKFYVNEEERVVVCVIPATQHMLEYYIRENFSFHDIDFWYAMNYNELSMPSSFMGKAVCSADDEWNEELGRMIAFSRAKDKCYKSFFKRANKFVQLIDRRLGNMIESFNNFGMKLEQKKDSLTAKIDELIEKE